MVESDKEGVLELAHKLLKISELAIDGGEAHVGDRIQIVELPHDALAHFLRRHLALERLRKLSLQRIDQRLELIHAHRTLLARLDQPGEQLFPVEGLATVILLDDHQGLPFHLLVGGEAKAAIHTLPTPTNRKPILRGSRIDDFIVVLSAAATLHLWLSRQATH